MLVRLAYEYLFPAQAGVILEELDIFTREESFPRASGGDPKKESKTADNKILFPAQAGVILKVPF